jgi:CRISPR-associated protein Csb1
MALKLTTLDSIVASGAAIRRRRHFQPTAGEGASISPPTYPSRDSGDASVHLFEDRMIDSDWQKCVVIDSVQSQANRFENILEHLAQTEDLPLPRLVVKLTYPGIEYLTSLTVPHRAFDAILRDSLVQEDGEEIVLIKSQLGQRIDEASPIHAAALLEIAPNTLLFGGWKSTWGDPRGAKFARCVSSEMIGVDVRPGQRAAGRMDPLVIGNVDVFEKKDAGDRDPGYTSDPDLAAQSGNKPAPFSFREDKKNPAKKITDINHGMIPPTVVRDHGVSVRRIDQLSVINMPALRQLQFPDASGTHDESRDLAARSYLAAMGLIGLTGFGEGGVALRSRCELVAEADPPFEVLGHEASSFTLDLDEAKGLFVEAASRLPNHGFDWSPAPIYLRPSDDFDKLIEHGHHADIE